MVVKKIPLRTCCVSKEQCPKKDLFRVVRTPEGEVVVDLKGKANGRGAYLKKDQNIILKASKTKVLERQLECEVKEDIYTLLLELVKLG